jgi:hypothetical protein
MRSRRRFDARPHQFARRVQNDRSAQHSASPRARHVGSRTHVEMRPQIRQAKSTSRSSFLVGGDIATALDCSSRDMTLLARSEVRHEIHGALLARPGVWIVTLGGQPRARMARARSFGRRLPTSLGQTAGATL